MKRIVLLLVAMLLILACGGGSVATSSTINPFVSQAPEKTWNGSGQDVLNDIWLETFAKLEIVSHGRSNIIVVAYNTEKDDWQETLVNEIGQYRGTRWLPPGKYMISVKADGPWSITAKPFTTNAAELNMSADTGDYVSDTFAFQRGSYIGKTQTTKNFIVWLYCSNGDKTLVFNEIGPFAGATVVKGGGWCFWDVQSNGKRWSLERQ